MFYVIAVIVFNTSIFLGLPFVPFHVVPQSSKLFITNLATGTQKGTGLLIPFVMAILGTKFFRNLCLVRQNSAQLRTKVIKMN